MHTGAEQNLTGLTIDILAAMRAMPAWEVYQTEGTS